MQSAQKQSDNDKLINAIVGGDLLSVAKEVGNDLAGPAISLCDEMAKNLNALKALSPLCTSVSGSGATTFAIFETRELALWARDKLLRQGYNAEAVPTVNPQKAKKRRFLFA